MSEGQEVGFNWETTSDSWDGETGRKSCNVLVDSSNSVRKDVGGKMSALMLLILSVKKFLNVSQVAMSGVGEVATEVVGFRMEFMVLKRTWGLFE